MTLEEPRCEVRAVRAQGGLTARLGREWSGPGALHYPPYIFLKLPKEHHPPFFPALSPLLKLGRAGGIR